MVVLTMIEMAGRSGKVISLTKGDLHRENSYLHVYRSGMADTGENKEELLAPISTEWWNELDAYLEKRPTLKDNDLLFPLTNGDQMNSGQWANRFRGYCLLSGPYGSHRHVSEARLGACGSTGSPGRAPCQYDPAAGPNTLL